MAADRAVLVCYGDSITAGYGLQTGQSFPDALQRTWTPAATTTRSRTRAPAAPPPKTRRSAFILLLHPEVAIVEFGGNDGLRGILRSRPAATSTRC